MAQHYDAVQATNGKWYLYVVDDSVSTALDGDGKGMEYGVQCTTGLGIETGTLEASVGSSATG